MARLSQVSPPAGTLLLPISLATKFVVSGVFNVANVDDIMSRPPANHAGKQGHTARGDRRGGLVPISQPGGKLIPNVRENDYFKLNKRNESSYY